MIVDLFIMYSGGWLGSCAAARPHKVRANAARILKRGLLLGVGKRENDDSDSRAESADVPRSVVRGGGVICTRPNPD